MTLPQIPIAHLQASHDAPICPVTVVENGCARVRFLETQWIPNPWIGSHLSNGINRITEVAARSKKPQNAAETFKMVSTNSPDSFNMVVGSFKMAQIGPEGVCWHSELPTGFLKLSTLTEGIILKVSTAFCGPLWVF